MKVLVSGAGIAGPTLAHWLLRGGHEPTLVERAPAFRTGGYVIDFWGVGYRVAERMGIERAVLDAGYRVRELRSVDDAGRIRATLDTDVFQRVAAGKFTSLPRGDLAALAYATIESRVEALFGDSIASIDEHANGVQVGFEHGAERDFDLVVGADGLHSNVRRIAFGPASACERFLGCRVAACVVEGYRPRDELVYVTHNVPNRQIGRFALRGDRTMFLFVFRSGARDIPDDIAAHKAVLRREFADAGWECPAILRAMESADELYFDVVSQIQMPGWSRGRIALLGDAAACVSLLAGEGTGLAMAGAYVLAGELQRADGDWRRAFPAYEAKMRPLVRDKQDAARKYLAFFATRTRLGIRLRDLGLRIANHPSLAGLFVGRGLRDDFDLPEYGPWPGVRAYAAGS
jgi:2-polyprenyl-6-methoxyphenol hydroxylase-like FAD-dependent oxidoreductase